jgi:hypothetical protein
MLDAIDQPADSPPRFVATASARTAPPAFQAWRRAPKGRWLVVAQGETEAEVWERLCKIMDRSVGHHDSLILPYPQEP